MAPRQFLTERLFREVLVSRSAGAEHPAMEWLCPKLPVVAPRKQSISIEVEACKSEVGTHVSDGSWVPSLSTTVDQSILSELEQLRQEKAQLLAENAALAAEQGKAPSSLDSAARGGKTEPLGASVRYLVTTPMGASSPCSFELGLGNAAQM